MFETLCCNAIDRTIRIRKTAIHPYHSLTTKFMRLTHVNITIPKGMPKNQRVTAYGGGALIFNEYGQLKYQIPNRIEDAKRQSARLRYLWESGYFDQPPDPKAHFALMHLKRAGVQGGF